MYLTIVCQIYWNLFFESTFRRSRMLFENWNGIGEIGERIGRPPLKRLWFPFVLEKGRLVYVCVMMTSSYE